MEALNQKERKFAEEHHALIYAFLRCYHLPESDMTSETKVTIVAHDGTTKELTGDTVICFTVSKAAEFLSGKAKIIDANEAFVGYEIPDPIFAATIASLVGSLIEVR